MVDAWDRGRFQESKNELDSLLTDEALANCPVLILGNKIDKPGAASEDEIRNFFGLYQLTTGKVRLTKYAPSRVGQPLNPKKKLFCLLQGKVSRAELSGRPLELFMCSVLKRQGYGEGFRWLAQYID